MAKISKNLVVIKDPPKLIYDVSLKAGNMFLNRFCINEDDAFELTGVHYFKEAIKGPFSVSDKTKGRGIFAYKL